VAHAGLKGLEIHCRIMHHCLGHTSFLPLFAYPQRRVWYLRYLFMHITIKLAKVCAVVIKFKLA